MKQGKIFILLILTASIVLSYFHSREIYTFYINTYYTKFKKMDRTALLARAQKLYLEKKYDDLIDFLTPLRIVYPGSVELIQLEGLAWMHKGDTQKGTDILLSSLKKGDFPEEGLVPAVQSLYDRRLYREVISLLKTNRAGTDPGLWYYYALSFYKIGKYHESVQAFTRAITEGRNDFQVYLYLGESYERLGEDEKALASYTEAWRRNSRDRGVNRSLLGIYRKLGRYDDAERLLRQNAR